MNRRNFIGAAAGFALGAGGIFLPQNSLAQSVSNDLEFDLTRGVRSVSIYRPETRETLNLVYMKDGVWQSNAYQRLCWLMRDIHINRAVAMDHNLIAIVDWTQRYLARYGYSYPLHLLSAYRSESTNSRLEGAAKNSQHTKGRALDLRIPGLSAEYLGQLFRWLSQGGVGTYMDREFVHLDTGSIRQWYGR